MTDKDRKQPRRRTPIYVHRFNASLTTKISQHAMRDGETLTGFVNRIVKERLAALDDEA